jgi:hypothetical protein
MERGESMKKDPAALLKQELEIDKLIEKNGQKFQEPVTAFIIFSSTKMREIVAKYTFKKTDAGTLNAYYDNSKENNYC